MQNHLKILTAVIIVFMALSIPVYAGVTETDGLGTSWLGAPTLTTANPPGTDTTAEGNFGSGGFSGFGAMAQTFELSSGGTLSSFQLYLSGQTQTVNVFLYDLGAYPSSGYPSTSASYTGTTGANLLAAGDTFTYNGGNGGAANVAQLQFTGADANITLQAGELYALEIDPTSADSMYWIRGGVQTFNGQAYRASSGTTGNPPAMGALNGAIRDFDFAVTLTPAPEPSTFALAGGVLAMLAVVRRYKK